MLERWFRRESLFRDRSGMSEPHFSASVVVDAHFSLGHEYKRQSSEAQRKH